MMDIVRAMIEVNEIASQIEHMEPGSADLTLLDARLETIKQKLISKIDKRIEEIDDE